MPVLGGVVAIGIAVSACASGGSSSSTDASSIKVGVQFGLTGVDAGFDSTYQDGAKLAFGDIASSGINGKSVSFLYADDASDPATAVSVARKNVTQDGVSVLYGPAFTTTALSTMQVATSSKIPFYTPGSINPGLTSPLNQYTFAPNFSSDDVATGIAKLVKSMGVQNVGMLVEDDAYGASALTAAQTALGAVGLSVNSQQKIAATATDATSQISALKQAGSDVILLGVTAPAIAAALNAETSQSAYIPLVTFAGSNTSLDKIATSDPKIIYYALTPLACPLGAACTADFMAKWTAAYPNETPIVWTAQAYAAAEAFIAGLKNAKDDTPQGIVTGFETMQPYSSPELPCPIQFSTTSHKGNSCTNFYGITGGATTFFGSDVTDNTLTDGK
ncbi:MAG: transporter permease [Subtercola sp.]|nr:transporter permease [Subtercola sp.]